RKRSPIRIRPTISPSKTPSARASRRRWTSFPMNCGRCSFCASSTNFRIGRSVKWWERQLEPSCRVFPVPATVLLSPSATTQGRLADMTCANCIESLGYYIDGELPAEEAALIEEHLKTCADCAQAHRRLADTSTRVKAALMRYEAPDVLKARIRATLADPARQVAAERPRVSLFRLISWPSTVAAAAVIAVMGGAVTLAISDKVNSTGSVEQEVLTSHIRSLMPGHLT